MMSAMASRCFCTLGLAGKAVAAGVRTGARTETCRVLEVTSMAGLPFSLKPLAAAARQLHSTTPMERSKSGWTRSRSSRWAAPREQWPRLTPSQEELLEKKLTGFMQSSNPDNRDSEAKDDVLSHDSLRLKLSPKERAWVHHRCRELKLRSRSSGKGPERVLEVSQLPEIKYSWEKNPKVRNTKATPSNNEILSSPQIPDFAPENLQRSLLKTLELEEMFHRNKNSPKPFFTSGSIIRVTYQEARSRQTLRRMVGIVTSKVNRGLGSSFTIRNVIEGLPFEMSFNTYHPLVYSIEVLELQRRRRSKLYYLRNSPDKFSTFSQNYQGRG